MIIGLIVNPLSSKDIRRLVALGRVVDVEEKANLVARFLVGVAAGPHAHVLALNDRGGVVRRGLRLAGRDAADVSWLSVETRGTEADTVAAAAMLREQRAAVVAVVGGDGTVRAAVEGWTDMPLLVLPAGTNNAFAPSVEPTVAGRAAAYSDDPQVAAAAFRRRLRLLVEIGDESATAVVDAVSVTDHWTAGRALWRPAHLLEAIVTTADPAAVGMAGVAAAFGPLAHDRVRHLRFGSGRPVRAVFAPGLVADLSISDVEDIPPMKRVTFDPTAKIVALDGERRVLVGGEGSVVAVPGPSSFDPVAALATVFERSTR